MWYTAEPGNIVTRNMLVVEQVQRFSGGGGGRGGGEYILWLDNKF